MGTVRGVGSLLFNAEEAAQSLKKSFKGLGTDEKMVILVIGTHDNKQRQEIKKSYKSQFGQSLADDLEEELGGHFLDLALALCCPNYLFDAHTLRKAMKGAGTDEKCLIEVLCSRSNSEIELIKEAYYQEFGRHLEDDIISETSSNFRKLLRSIVTANRGESETEDQKLADQDVDKLIEAGPNKWGTDESVFNQILCTRSSSQLKLTSDVYHKKTGDDFEQIIRKEFSGNVEEGFLTIIKVAKNPISYYAERLFQSMKGAGTDDESLIRIIVTRSEIDLQVIKDEYQRKYKKSLVKAVKDDCSGDYCRLLIKIIGE